MTPSGGAPFSSRRRTTLWSVRSLLSPADTPATGQENCWPVSPRTGSVIRWSTMGLPGSWGTPMCTCPALRPRRDEHRQAIAAMSCSLPASQNCRLSRSGHFGAQSHGLHARCLRFAAPVTRSPRKTRFRRVANLYRVGFKPTGSLTQFQSNSCHSSQATRLFLAHKDPTPTILQSLCFAARPDPFVVPPKLLHTV